jgi:hypothetical protein
MATIKSFLSEGFLEEFHKKFPRDFFSDEFAASTALYHFLAKHDDVVLGGEKKDYADLVQSDGLGRILIDKYLQGDDTVVFDQWETKELPTRRKPFPFYFLSSQHNQLKKDKLDPEGLPSYQLSNPASLHQFIGYEAIPVTKESNYPNRLQSWKDLKGKLLPFNSVIIIDNYLLTNKLQSEVTVRMIEKLLRSNEVIRHITLVFSAIDSRKGWTIDKAVKIIEGSRIGKGKLSIVRLNSTQLFHDRLFITNSQFMTSGSSFNTFESSFNTSSDKEEDKKPDNPTILNLNSHACTYGGNKWSDIATQTLTFLKKLIENESNREIKKWDPSENPLLSS